MSNPLHQTTIYDPDGSDTTDELEAAFTQGDYVSWDIEFGADATLYGKVEGVYQEGDDMPDFRGDRNLSPEGDEYLYALTRYKEDEDEDGLWHPVEGKPIGHYEDQLSEWSGPDSVSPETVEMMDGNMSMSVPKPGEVQLLYPSESMAMEVADMMGLDGVHAHMLDGNEWYMPGSDHGAFVEVMSELRLADRGAMDELASPMIDRPTDGGTRAVFHTPTEQAADEADVEAILDVVESELGVRYDAMATDEGVMFEAHEDTGVGPIETPHPHLDVAESAAQNRLGKPQKSTLFIAGDAEDMSIQPCFMMDDRFDDAVVDEIERLFAFVAGHQAALYYAENRLYFDVKAPMLPHGALDVAEILVRRMAERHDRSVESHSFKALAQVDQDATELDQHETRPSFDAPAFAENDYVRLQVRPDVIGRVAYIHRSDKTLELQIVEPRDGELVDTGHTMTIGYDSVYHVTPDEMGMESFPSESELGESNVANHVVGENDWAQWYPETGPQEAHGKVEDINEYDDETKPDEVVVRMYKMDDDGVWHPTDHVRRLRMDEVEGWGNYPTDDAISDERLSVPDNADAELLDEPDWASGMLVRWQVNPDMMGEIVHVDHDKHIVMVEIHEPTDEGLESTGYTVTAGYSDLVPMSASDTGPRRTEMASDARKADEEEPDEDEIDPDEEFDESTKTALENKVEEHNEKHGDEEGKEVTYDMLRQVYEKGIGAYNNSHRPGMAPGQWAMARVNAFLFLVRNGHPENDNYTQDNHLLPEDHPKHSSEENALGFGADVALLSDHDHVWLDGVAELADTTLDEVYADWEDSVNMTAAQLRRWARNPCAQEASLDTQSVIERNLALLETPKAEWTEEHMSAARRTISFTSRMMGVYDETDDPMDGAHGCPADVTASLLNWARRPNGMDVPSPPDEGELADETGFSEDELEPSL